MSSVSLPVRTARTSFINADFGTALVPYDRIVAIEAEPGRMVECPDIGDDPLTDTLLPFPDQNMASRFAGYFESVIARNDIRLPGYTTRPEANYNCHDFANVVVDKLSPSGWQNANDHGLGPLSAYSPLARGARVKAGLRGILLNRRDKTVVHSFVSLGGERCLNVLAIGGAVGTTSYDDMIKDYSIVPNLDLMVRAPAQQRALPSIGRVLSQLF